MSELHLAELIGNKDIRTQLTIAQGAALLHNKAMGHTLFSGLAGCGKTSSAKAVASLTGAPFFEVNAESVRTAEELAKVFDKFPDDGYNPVTGEKVSAIKPSILFIDEAHRLTLKMQEILGITMENFRHTFAEGRGKAKIAVTTWVPEFTLICATTKEGELSKPFRDRFMFSFIFGSYTLEESEQIVLLHAKRMGVNLDEEATAAIARRGRGTPRILVRFLANMHAYMAYLGRESITQDLVEAQFELMGVDPIGLTRADITILKDLYYSEGPKGLDSLAVKTNLDPKTISEVNEPFLILLNFVERSKSGRLITDSGVKHLVSGGHIEPPQQAGGSRVVSRAKYRG
jgi:Holliday junction DNA helicase RuvB